MKSDIKANKENELFSNRMLLQMMIPLVIELALTLVVGLTDSIMVSSAGEAAGKCQGLPSDYGALHTGNRTI